MAKSKRKTLIYDEVEPFSIALARQKVRSYVDRRSHSRPLKPPGSLPKTQETRKDSAVHVSLSSLQPVKQHEIRKSQEAQSLRTKASAEPKLQNVYTRRLKTRSNRSQTRSNPSTQRQNRQPIRRSRDRLSQHQSREERRRRRHRVSPRPVVVGRFIGGALFPVNTRKSSDKCSTRAVDSEGEKDSQPHI